MVERVTNAAFDNAGRFQRGELVFGLPLKFRFADKHRDHGGASCQNIFGRDAGRALGLPDSVGVFFQAPQQCHAKTLLVRAALRRWDRIAIGLHEPVLDAAEPCDRPFKRSVTARLFDFSGKNLIRDQGFALDIAGEIIFQAGRKAKDGLRSSVSQRHQRDRLSSGPF